MVTLLSQNTESVAEEKVEEAHRKVMVANHPDAGGSTQESDILNQLHYTRIIFV